MSIVGDLQLIATSGYMQADPPILDQMPLDFEGGSGTVTTVAPQIGTGDPMWVEIPTPPMYPQSVPQRLGWTCPKCNKGVSPDQQTCPCSGSPQPFLPFTTCNVIN